MIATLNILAQVIGWTAIGAGAVMGLLLLAATIIERLDAYERRIRAMRARHQERIENFSAPRGGGR